MVALARNFDLAGPCVLAGWTAILLSRLHYATAWEMGTSILLGCRHGVLLKILNCVYNAARSMRLPMRGFAGGGMVSTESAVTRKDSRLSSERRQLEPYLPGR